MNVYVSVGISVYVSEYADVCEYECVCLCMCIYMNSCVCLCVFV